MITHPGSTKKSKNTNVRFRFPSIDKRFLPNNNFSKNKEHTHGSIMHHSPKHEESILSKFMNNCSPKGNLSTSSVISSGTPQSGNQNISQSYCDDTKFKDNEVLKIIFSKNYVLEGIKNRYKGFGTRSNKSVPEIDNKRTNVLINSQKCTSKPLKPLRPLRDYVEQSHNRANAISDNSLNLLNKTTETTDEKFKLQKTNHSKFKKKKESLLLKYNRRYEPLQSRDNQGILPRRY
ncbi:unnamed protein product [Moneuplotes crassus]|uniref:Uncharacterized protein n=1 Tax=Euplotes crassus TaxID=5936 RepID=A0AAD1XB35_EUPCR|nr:unnamed protein product [Moneuplotes crassus]